MNDVAANLIALLNGNVVPTGAAVLTDGTTAGGTITVGTTAPGSPGPRDVWIDPAASPQASDIAGVVPLAIFLAPGDIIYATAAGALVRLPIGTPGQALIVSPDGTDLEYATPSAPTVVRTHYVKTVTATPSATSGTYGTVQTDGLDASDTSIVPLGIVYTPTGVASETVTLAVVATYNDATTATISNTITNNTAGSFGASGFSGLFTDGKYIVSLAIKAKSTINSSAASISVTVFGLNT
jgi:hypothetical protein